ncbi:MAG: histidine kinase [Ignavibacteriaceae bacterium]|nr:histidine kinase [Ignavibacteriaceae bacterium]
MTITKTILLFLLLLKATTTFAQDSVSVQFIVNTPKLNDSDLVFITGNGSLLGNWNPNLIILHKINDSTWSRKFWFNKGESIEFKFTKGSWDHEALNDDGSTPKNNNLEIVNDTTIFFQIRRWSNKEPKLIHGQITGTVRYHLNFVGDGLKPRDIIVWLPPSYDSCIDKRYPVLYMHDGQNIIDPATSSYGYDWKVDEVADSLIKENTINELIIVGIYNTTHRTKEYSHSSLGYSYMNFIVTKLKPFIDNQYRTLPERKYTAVAGSSMGGLISFMLAWCYPEVFSMAACFSPAFKVYEYNYVDTVHNYLGNKKNIKLYIDNGGIGIETELQPGIDEMIAALQNKGYEKGKDLIWYFDKDAAHTESAWAKRFWRPLILFFGKSNN